MGLYRGLESQLIKKDQEIEELNEDIKGMEMKVKSL